MKDKIVNENIIESSRNEILDSNKLLESKECSNMNENIKISTLEELTYTMQQMKKEKLPMPIVFLGAGASKSGGIPLAREIENDILSSYSDNPRVKREENKTYSKLMECLTPYERNKLLKGYIDRAKINVTHLYLAQLLKKDYIDYILTVNFDNLMVRASALCNEFPPTYDLAVLKDLTTTTITKKSITYLHGQHHGLWLLNTKKEMEKVSEVVPNIIHSIKDRPWIFIGYSGEDLIFEHIVKLGRFDKGLYWIGYNDNEPSDKVCKGLLEIEHANAFLIKGYDSDNFVLKLSDSLGVKQPDIINKPFTTLKETINNIVDIEDEKINGRLKVVKGNIEKSIQKYETDEINTIKKQIYELKRIMSLEGKKLETLNEMEKLKINNKVKNSKELKFLLSNLYIDLSNTRYIDNEEKINYYEEALKLNPQSYLAYRNRADAKSYLKDYEEAIKDYNKALNINPKLYSAYGNRANAKSHLGNHESAIEDYDKMLEAGSKNPLAYMYRGVSKMELKMYKEALKDYEEAIKLNPKEFDIYIQKAICHNQLKEYEKAIKTYEKALEINPKSDNTYVNRGNAKSKLELYKEAIEDYNKALEINPKSDNAYVNRGNSESYLGNEEKALEDYNKALKINPLNEIVYLNRGHSKSYLGNEKEAIKNYEKVLELNPVNEKAYLYKGMSEMMLKDYKNALKDYIKVLELNSKNMLAYSEIGVIKNILGKYKEAIENYSTSINLEPSKEVYNNRAESRIFINEYNLALEDLEKCLEIDKTYKLGIDITKENYDEFKSYLEKIEKKTEIQEEVYRSVKEKEGFTFVEPKENKE